ncbi:MAG TPA: MBL fold metallo-hydrolase [Flavobacteriales bacterium]|jgi:pyrroloquinoline quinone biosynthesis protein B|nr:MBL fold metallo-hydrolase [Flavobacteriales bacterium]
MRVFLTIIILATLACNKSMKKNEKTPYVVVLGVAQDAGYPQAGCNKDCCKDAWEDPAKRKNVSCLALVDPISKEQWIFDATPDVKFQLQLLEKKSGINPLSGVFITHAHMGHYTGLMHFGREVMGCNNLPVYCMERMQNFIKTNAPWDQLVKIENIKLKLLRNDSAIELNQRISVTPFLVPHRDEYSETVGYKIKANNKSLIFIPDIDKWEQWETDITELIKKVDYAFLDATFYKNGELKRDMSEIPHPFVEESMGLFSNLSETDKQKVHFIHCNHTNPLLQEGSNAQKEVIKKGFNFAKEGQVIRF